MNDQQADDPLYSDDPPSLLAELLKARRQGDDTRARLARDRLEERFGILVRFKLVPAQRGMG